MSIIRSGIRSIDDLSGIKEPLLVMSNVNLDEQNLTQLPPITFDYVGGYFSCMDNEITSLVGIHKKIKDCLYIYLERNPIKEGGLGLLLIKNLNVLRSELYPIQIIATYLGKGKRGMIDCQTELIKKGYKDFAKL